MYNSDYYFPHFQFFGGFLFFTFSSNNKKTSHRWNFQHFAERTFFYSLINFQRFFLFIYCYWWFFLKVDFEYFHLSLIASVSKIWIDVSFCYTCIVWPNFNLCKKNCLHQRQHIFQDKKRQVSEEETSLMVMYCVSDILCILI